MNERFCDTVMWLLMQYAKNISVKLQIHIVHDFYIQTRNLYSLYVMPGSTHLIAYIVRWCQ